MGTLTGVADVHRTRVEKSRQSSANELESNELFAPTLFSLPLPLMPWTWYLLESPTSSCSRGTRIEIANTPIETLFSNHCPKSYRIEIANTLVETLYLS